MRYIHIQHSLPCKMKNQTSPARMVLLLPGITPKFNT